MVEPRYAAEPPDGRHRSRKWLATLVAVAVVLAGAATWLLWPDRQQDVSAADGQHSASPAGGDRTASPTASAAPSSSGTPSSQSGDSAAVAAVQSCRAQISSEEKIIDAARTGVEHWADHVQSQTDRFAGRISESQMKVIWVQTKLAGPADVERYSELADEHPERKNACQDVDGAPKDIARTLATCRQRQDVIKPLLSASDKAMADWEHHLADMRRSASGQAHHAEQVWLDTWRKAPKNIKAFQAADEKLQEAPACK